MNRIRVLHIALAGLMGVSLLAGTAAAQTTDTTGGTTTGGTTTTTGGSSQDTYPLPRNNVTGGSLAANRPGLWIQSGISTHTKRSDLAFGSFGGATYLSQDQLPPTLKDNLLAALIDSFLNALNGLVQALQLVINPP